ncbi:nucleotide exchange factor GrpE [Candidatus Saccharibacteria bacterium]|nr:nucleotide exchange factor GrpE [Candidatus Saccharibacteria bacterium]
MKQKEEKKCECGEQCECGENCECGESCECGCQCESKEFGKQIAELTNDLQRTRADFENFRKQIEIQKENERKMTKYATVMKILPLIDDMDRATATYEELKPVAKSMDKVLKDLNLERIDSGEGAEFNPELHDAVMVEGEGEKEVIAETLRPGYYYEGEVLRPAMVKVKKI